MGIQSPVKDQTFLVRGKLLAYALYTLLLIAGVRLCFFPTPTALPATTTALDRLLVPISPSKSKEEERGCDYSEGKWVHDKRGPMYNSTSCGTIKEGQNCARHGRPDTGYLYWRWSPNKCHLPRFDPIAFLQLTRGKHVAFVGDSIARNQLESLLCLLSTVSLPSLVFAKEENKFRKWRFPSHNVNVSVYWSPFLVEGIEKSQETPYNRLYLDSVNEAWAKDLGEMDMVVLSVGHWFLHPAVFYYGDAVLGCHSCKDSSYTEVGFYDVFGMAFNTSLKALAERGRRMDVIVTTFSPAHFVGDWDSTGACAETEPFMEEERRLEGMDAEMRRREVEAVEAARVKGKRKGFRVEALDVSRLALMRPDGHPGAYMYPFPFANGKPQRLPNDCVHWCLPGPIDTWNQIMLHVITAWASHDQLDSR